MSWGRPPRSWVVWVAWVMVPAYSQAHQIRSGLWMQATPGLRRSKRLWQRASWHAALLKLPRKR